MVFRHNDRVRSRVQEAGDKFRGAILNPGGWSQTLDAIRLRLWDRRARRLGLPAMSGGPVPCGIREPSDRDADPELLTAEFYRHHLLDDLLPFWARAESGGAFRVSLRRDGTNWDGPTPSATAQARMVYAFARGHTVSEDSGFDEVAARAVDHLISSYWDRTYGGWYRQVDAGGTVVDASKFSFDQAYVLTGLAEYLRVTDEERVRRYLVDTLDLIEKQVWDSRYGGYYEWLERDWSIRSSRKTLCIHIDLLAGLLAVNTVMPEQGLFERARTLAGLIRDRMLDARSAQLLEVFRRDFVYSPFDCDDTVVIGHGFKVAKHFLMVSELADDPTYAEAARRIVDRALEFAWDHEQGGLVHEVFRNGVIKSGEKVWWTVCEGMITLLMLGERTMDHVYQDLYHELATFAFQYFADPECGEWITSTHRSGAPKCTNKGGTLEKAAFHTVEMASHALMILEQRALRIDSSPP